MYTEMSVTLISVSHDTVVSNKHEEWTRHYYVNFQHSCMEKRLEQSITSWVSDETTNKASQLP